MMAAIGSGDWVTPERLRVYPLMLLLFAAAATAVSIMTADGVMGPNDLPLGSDFGQVWVAGKEVLAGQPTAPYDIHLHGLAQRAAFPRQSGIFGWHYPPYFLAPAALLAHLPYLQALSLWQVTTLALYLLSIFAILRGSGLRPVTILVAALAFPAVVVNLGHGQNGFLTAALLGGGFVLLDRRPMLAGALFALLGYKPQFALTLPLALLIGGHWRAIVGAAATLLAMTAGSIALFGLASWAAFFDSLGFTRTIVEEGATGFEKIQSVFAAVRLLGGGVQAAYICQGVTTILALGALAALLRTEADRRVKAAATIVAMFLTTPYALDYDMMALAPAMALLLSHGLEKGFRPYEKSGLVFAYAAPLLARPAASALFLPLGVAAVLFLFATTAGYLFKKGNQWEEAVSYRHSVVGRRADVDHSTQFCRRRLTLKSRKVNFL